MHKILSFAEILQILTQKCYIMKQNVIIKTIYRYLQLSFLTPVLGVLILILTANELTAQTQIIPCGNIKGIRVEGDIIKFKTDFRVIKPGWDDVNKTAKEAQEPSFERQDSKAVIETQLNNISITEKVTDEGRGAASASVAFTANKNVTMAGAYMCLELPKEDFSEPEINFIDKQQQKAGAEKNYPQSGRDAITKAATAKGITIEASDHTMEVNIPEATKILVQKGDPSWGTPDPKIYFTIIPGNASKGQKAEKTFNIEVSGEIDKQPVNLTMDASSPGRKFDGIGGNFRLQSDKDPEVIEYNLNHLDVNWGRVEMP